MKIRKFFWTLILCILIPITGLCAETAGIISDMSGTVEITRGDYTTAAEFGSELFAGDKIKVGDDSKADILMQNGDFINLKSNQEQIIQIKRQVTRGPASESREISEIFSEKSRSEILANPVSLREGEDIITISPRKSTINFKPTFYWQVNSNEIKHQVFKIIITDSNGKEIVNRKVENTTEFKLPDNIEPLVPDKIYTWVVLTEDMEYASEETYFKVLEEEKIEEFREVYGNFRKKYITSENTLLIQYGSYLIDNKMYADAFVYFHELNKRTPKSKFVHQMLAITHLKQKLLLPYNQEIKIISELGE